MKKISFLIVIALFFASCASESNKDQLKELKSKRNELKTEINNINEKISQLQNEIQGEGGELQSRNVTYVGVTKAQPDTFKHFVNVQGEISTDNNIVVPVESPGVVTAVYVEEGDDVARGQKIAETDATIIRKQIDEIENGLAFARDVFERRKRLWEKNIGSEIQYLQAKNNKETLEKKLATVKEQLGKTIITAPISGTVDEIFLKKGEMAPAGFTAARVVKLSDMKIKAEVSEKYLHQIKKGNQVLVNPANSKETFTSEVITVGKVINPENRTFMVEVALPQKDDYLTPNMILELNILDYQKDSVITVPVNVIQNTQNKQFLFVAKRDGDGWKSEKRWISVGRSSKNRVEILEGVKPGEKVISSGYQGLADQESIVIKK